MHQLLSRVTLLSECRCKECKREIDAHQARRRPACTRVCLRRRPECQHRAQRTLSCADPPSLSLSANRIPRSTGPRCLQQLSQGTCMCCPRAGPRCAPPACRLRANHHRCALLLDEVQYSVWPPVMAGSDRGQAPGSSACTAASDERRERRRGREHSLPQRQQWPANRGSPCPGCLCIAQVLAAAQEAARASGQEQDCRALGRAHGSSRLLLQRCSDTPGRLPGSETDDMHHSFASLARAQQASGGATKWRRQAPRCSHQHLPADMACRH